MLVTFRVLIKAFNLSRLAKLNPKLFNKLTLVIKIPVNVRNKTTKHLVIFNYTLIVKVYCLNNLVKHTR